MSMEDFLEHPDGLTKRNTFTPYQGGRLQEMSDRLNGELGVRPLLHRRLKTDADKPDFPSPRGISLAAYIEYSLRKVIRRLRTF